MRKIYDTNGNDVTTSVQATLKAGRTLYLADLFFFQHWIPYPYGPQAPQNFFFTTASFPVAVTKVQTAPGVLTTVNATYIPKKMQRGKLAYGIGFNAETMELTWFIDDSVHFTGLPWGYKWAFAAGYLDEMNFWMHRAFFTASPHAGGTLLGTTCMWRGVNRKVEIRRDALIVTFANLMDLFQRTQIPTQKVEPGNRQIPYLPAGSLQVMSGILGNLPLNTSTPMDIQFTNDGDEPADHAMQDGYFCSTTQGSLAAAFQAINGQPPPVFFRIRDNVTSGGILHVYPYEPIDPYTMLVNNNVFTFFFLQNPPTGGVHGFPYVPQPETHA